MIRRVRRRPVLVALVAACLLFLAPLAWPAPRLLVAVGEVTATTAVVWARGPVAGDLDIEVMAIGVSATTGAKLPAALARDLTGQVLLTGLTPKTRYAYRIAGGGEVAAGEFVTAPTEHDREPVRFLWSGDLGGGGFCRRLDGGYRIFRAMARYPSDFFLFVGDTIYADRRCDQPGLVPGSDFVARTLTEFRRKHHYNREDPAAAAFYRTRGVYAIWDDHEVRNDFSGSTDPLMPVGRQAFLEYWPLAPPTTEPTRLYRRVRWGQLVELFILDTRQYRSPNTDADGPGKTMLGAAQRRWLIEGVTASDATWKVIVSSVPLAVPTGRPERRDSWSNASVWGVPAENGTGFAVERDAILRAFRERHVRNLVFVTADVHHAELIQHHPTPGYSFHEFIAGPLSATLGTPRPLDGGLNARSLFARGGVNNFGEVTVEPGRLTVRVIDEEGTVLFTHTIGVE